MLYKTNFKYTLYHLFTKGEEYEILYNEQEDIAYAIFEIKRDKNHDIKQVTHISKYEDFLKIMKVFKQELPAAEVVL